MKFEVLVSEDAFVLRHGLTSLWWPRPTATATDGGALRPSFRPLHSDRLGAVFDDNFVCHGVVYGLVGQFLADRLVLIKSRSALGRLPFGSRDEIFQINKIAVVCLQRTANATATGDSAPSPNIIPDLGLEPCSPDCCTRPVVPAQADPSTVSPPTGLVASFRANEADSVVLGSTGGASAVAGGLSRFSNSIKATASNIKQRGANKLLSTSSGRSDAVPNGSANASNGTSATSGDERDRLERRLVEELHKMFNENPSFYFSWSADLTNSLQRQQRQKVSLKVSDLRTVPLWRRVDERFYWNRIMSDSVRLLFDESAPPEVQSASHIWLLPIIQGYVQIERCALEPSEQTSALTDDEPHYWMTLISRRSRFRAGTRYKKRGLDADGNCANYVETEQIITAAKHTVSFVIVRGSVPLFWSQVGHKYRPPPILERTEPENAAAFRRHFEGEFELYDGRSIVVNLIEQQGREKVLADAFLEQALNLNDSRLTYIAFDFHERCRGMRFENVSILIDRVFELIKEVRYCWIDDRGTICEQRGVFRVNCVDCLDRTNLVMTAIAKAVMDIQLVRLGLLPPEAQLPGNSRRIFQLMWARNGDLISRQYAGTAALKGDYTRTGERKISGVVRDGVNSANRYYMNRFKDAYRQAVIDLMQGTTYEKLEISSPVESSSSSSTIKSKRPNSAGSEQEYHDRIKLVIEDCKKILVPEDEVILGGWPLMDADPSTGGIPAEPEMDIVLILTKDCYYVADYDDETDRIVKYQKVLLEDLEKIEIGAEPVSALNSLRPLSGGSARRVSYAMRFHYTIENDTGYFHMFRSTGTRFFNNMAIPINTKEEALESMKAIIESFKVALSVKSLNVPIYEVSRLERRKSKRLFTGPINSGSNQEEAEKSEFNSRKIITGITSGFSRLRVRLTGNNRPSSNKSYEPQETENSEEDDSNNTRTKKSKEDTVGSSSDLDSELEESELAQEISSSDPAASKDDRLLQSCGILVTSPTFKNVDEADKSRSVLDKIDDFVIDSMKRAQLMQIQRRATATSRDFTASTASIGTNQDQRPRSSSTRCIFSSELALNSIVSRTISRENFPMSDQFQSETDLRHQSIEPLTGSSSCAMLFEEENEFEYDDSSLIIPQHRGSDPMETPHIVCSTQDLHHSNIIKMSRSSTTLQDTPHSSGPMSLNLPTITSSSNSLATNVESSQAPSSNLSFLVKKEMVLSPLSRIAKGMQSLGLNLRSSLEPSSSQTSNSANAPSPAIDPELERRIAESNTRILLL